jgi:DNA ligase-1
MKFSEVAKVYEQLEGISSGNKMREVLASLFKKASKSEIKNIAYLTLGDIGSSYEDLVIGMADKMVLKALNASVSDYKKKGDIGLVAEESVSQSRPTLEVNTVIETLREIAQISGSGSQEKKIKLLATLFKRATKLEARYIARMVLGQLRLGAGDKTILDALSIARTGSKGARKQIEHAYNVCPDVGVIAENFASKGLKGLEHIEISLGIPIQMMLCQRIKSLDEIEKKMGYPVAVEQKYDGERVQVHKKGKDVTLFSRRLDNITNQFPDLVNLAKKNISARNAILECEACPVDAKGNLLKFQLLMQRRRKHKVEEYMKKIPVCFFMFDCLYNGKSLINKPYSDRYSALKKMLKPNKYIKVGNRKLCKSVDCVDDMFKSIISKKGEGVVIKSLKKDSTYQAGVRGWHWIKWKAEYVKDIRDTFDLVVVGAFYGKGKRAGSYGALLCAAYNKSKDQFETFCKVGSGFTDKVLSELPKKFRIVSKKPARVLAKIIPDVWLTPSKVIEVTGAEITKSPNHTCGGGLALRFPRFLKYREKKPEQATSVREIKNMAKK